MECIKYLNVTLLFIVIFVVFAELIISMNLVFFFMTFNSEEVLTLPTLFVMILVRYICSMYETTNVPKPLHAYIKKYGDAWIDLFSKALLKEVS